MDTQENHHVPEPAAKLPTELEHKLSSLRELFQVDQKKLKEITKRFGEELEEGLRADGQNVGMYLTWVLGFPSGREKGEYMTVDLGGTNLRVCWVVLHGSKTPPDVQQSEYKLTDEVKSGTAELLFDFIAEQLEEFIKEQDLKASKDRPLNLGFTFSYPTIQDCVDQGVLQTWTKGFEIDGVEGKDVAKLLRKAMEKRRLSIKLIALVNDTTGAMIASAYLDPHTIIGAVFGTGCNAAYMEDCGSISKLKADGLRPDTPMAINCEYGAFDNARKVLPLTKYDKSIDANSPKPGEQAFEKTSAGLYLGEIYRLIMLELHEEGLVFKSQDLGKLREPYSIDTGFLTAIEADVSHQMTETGLLFDETFGIGISEVEREFSRQLAESIALRGSRLCACGIAAICKKKKIEKGHVAADGSVANKQPKFKERWSQALAEILDWPSDRTEDLISLTPAEDGSGIGAAIIAAMTIERSHAGDRRGIKSTL